MPGYIGHFTVKNYQKAVTIVHILLTLLSL